MTDTEFAKNHLRDHLIGLIIPPISEGFWSIYTSAKELCDRNGQADQILRTFQNMITRIPEWSDVTISTEVERIVKVSKCTYLDDLLMGVFISYMKSFASLHYHGSSSKIKIEFERPNFTKFVHEVYKHSARKVWQVAYLFKTIQVSAEQQARNRQEIEKIIGDCMEQVIRSFLPWEQIAKNYFVDVPTDMQAQPPPASKSVMFEDIQDEDSDSEDEEDEEEDRPKMKVSDEILTLESEDLDKKPEEPKTVTIPEIDPLSEIESKMADSLVLNV